METGAQPGNKNAAKGKEFRQALKRVLARRSSTVSAGLETIAEKLLDAAENNEAWAIKEIADRFDGKPAQSIVGDDEHDAIRVAVNRIELVDLDERGTGQDTGQA